jgi:hypothetical protein
VSANDAGSSGVAIAVAATSPTTLQGHRRECGYSPDGAVRRRARMKQGTTSTGCDEHKKARRVGSFSLTVRRRP